ncbi:hypothetical protein [Caballeronia mineralivorans]|jgi:hypothetical protein|uniref:hypothetical protein n=1 Tax=Caballeronia mineralivorans TaxID=2010198 RepID=UPI002AFE0D5B|nr:hypothetical protein [Caballeronia mineralivorans]MEA3096739.1 hypothetical protein [Caballeronia mineralivorans]
MDAIWESWKGHAISIRAFAYVGLARGGPRQSATWRSSGSTRWPWQPGSRQSPMQAVSAN